jgi:hypothetical protein
MPAAISGVTVKEVAFPFQLPSWKSTRDWIASTTCLLSPEEDICNWLQDSVALVCRKAGRDENADTTSLAHIVAMTRIIDICTEGKLEILAIVCELIGCVRDDVQINRHNKKELGIAMMPLAYDSITKNKKMMWGWRGNPGTDQKMIFERTNAWKILFAKSETDVTLLSIDRYDPSTFKIRDSVRE